MDDLISRQMAIDAVHINYDEILDFKSTGRTIADSVGDIISNLPSAQNVQNNDLISRKVAIDAVKNVLNPSIVKFVKAKMAIEKLPSAHSEIIICKDCKHLFDGEHNANCCELLMGKAKWLTEITVDMNWYCADGERRTDERFNQQTGCD